MKTNTAYVRIVWILPTLALLFLAVNLSWTHAAMAAVFSDSCPEELIKDARERATSMYGPVEAQPVFSCQNAPVLGLDVSHGTTRFAPLLPAIIVLGPEGQNIDVAAHEFFHAELAARTSVLLRSYAIPTWFDEGLAMQLDHRPAYDRDALQRYFEMPDVTPARIVDLRWPSEFFQPGIQGRMHYAFAKCVVGSWLDTHSTGELNAVIEQTSWRSKFSVRAFEEHEALCMDSART